MDSHSGVTMIPMKAKKIKYASLPSSVADGIARHHAEKNLAYKQKLSKLKPYFQNLTLENGALCDAVAEIQTELALAMEERQLLLKKVMQIQIKPNQFHAQSISKGNKGIVDRDTEAETGT